ncbi:26 heat shock protein, mitochondrial [Glycine soja]
MALARLALKNLQQRVCASSILSGNVHKQRWNNELLKRFGTAAGDKGKSEGTEVAVTEGKKSNRMFPRRRGRRWAWRNEDHDDFPPALYELFPSGLGSALMLASNNINRLFENMNLTPWSLTSGRVKEKDDHYKLRYEMPGIAKEDVKITIDDDGVLTIKGEHKEEKDDDEQYWSSSSYGYYNTSLLLPDDAKADDIKAELKDGVLTLIIPKTQNPQKDVKQVTIE